MSAVVLCESPADTGRARSWVLARVALMTMTGEAVLLFAGSGRGESDKAVVDIVATRFSSVDRAIAVVAAWRKEEDFPKAASLRVMQIDEVQGVDPLIPMFP